IEPDSQKYVSITDPETQAPINDAAIGTSPVPCVITIEFAAWNPAPYIGDIDTEIEALYSEVSSIYQSLSPSVGDAEPMLEDDEEGEDDDDDGNDAGFGSEDDSNSDDDGGNDDGDEINAE